jgi:hypothetical protein
MREDVFMLFDEYAASFARGERPDTREYLERAGDESDDLATLIERYLERVPPPAPDEDAVALASAWLTSAPLLMELRTRRGLRRDEVVDALIATLSLDRTKREKVKRYYRELEGGLLNPDRVDRRVWDALAATLKSRARDLVAWRPQPAPIAMKAAFRLDAAMEAPVPSMARAKVIEPAAPDEIDRLFGAASELNGKMSDA